MNFQVCQPQNTELSSYHLNFKWCSVLSSVELTSILVPSYRLKVTALFSSCCSATVENAVLAKFKAFSFSVIKRYSVVQVFHSMSILWHIMKRDTMRHHEPPCDTMRHCETSWATMRHHETLWDIMCHHDTSWDILVKKDLEIQSEFEPGFSECRSDARVLPTEPLELWHWSKR